MSKASGTDLLVVMQLVLMKCDHFNLPLKHKALGQDLKAFSCFNTLYCLVESDVVAVFLTSSLPSID